MSVRPRVDPSAEPGEEFELPGPAPDADRRGLFSTLRRWLRKGAKFVVQWGPSIALLLLVWELIVRSGTVSRRLFPSPVDTFEAGLSLLEAGVLFTDFRFSLTRSVVGFVLGGIVGVLVGLLTGRLKPVEFILAPMIMLFRPIPAIALVPVATVWFGIGERAKYFVIAYSVFLAVWLNVHAGASSVSETHLRVARSLGASRTRTFREVVVPAAAPDIVNGLRYGSAVAFIVLIAAELAGARAGMGYRIQISAEFLQTDRIFFGLVQLGVLGAILDALFVFTSRRLIHWGER